jgi:hypothetical protein
MSLIWATVFAGVFDGLFHRWELYEWGNPIALIKFPGISLLSRLRYGLLAFVSTHRERWDALEELPASEHPRASS